MAVLDWINLLLLGGFLGLLGQGIRVVTGLKKLNDQAVREGKPLANLFETSTLLVSLLIGFIAGALAILGSTSGQEAVRVTKELAMTLIGAGYAGTDFIEAFIKKYLPTAQPAGTREPDETPAVG